MSMLSNLDLIRRVPLFSLLTADQAQAIADSVVKRRFRRGELVVEQGRKSNALFILLNGRARVLTSDTRGREVILAVLESGDYVGEMSLIDNEPHSATVRAEVQTDMLVLARQDFARCLPENSTLSYAILRGPRSGVQSFCSRSLMMTEPFSCVSMTPRSSRSFMTRLTISREAPTTLAMSWRLTLWRMIFTPSMSSAMSSSVRATRP